MTKLYFLKHNKSWLNVDQSLNIDLFYEDIRYLIKEENEILAKEIMIFYKELLSTMFTPPPPPPHIFVIRTRHCFLILPMTSRHYHQTNIPVSHNQFTYAKSPEDEIARLHPFQARLINYCLIKICLYVLSKRVCFLFNQMIFVEHLVHCMHVRLLPFLLLCVTVKTLQLFYML